jgi:hypothetical protein
VGGGLPAAASSAVLGRGGSGSRDQGGKFLGERSGPGRGGQELCDPLDAEGGRCKLGASTIAPPQAGPLTFLGRRGLERDSITDKMSKTVLLCASRNCRVIRVHCGDAVENYRG